MNLISLPETKNYLRVDHCEDDKLILTLIDTAQRLVMDVGRMTEKQLVENEETSRQAMLYTVSYLYWVVLPKQSIDRSREMSLKHSDLVGRCVSARPHFRSILSDAHKYRTIPRCNAPNCKESEKSCLNHLDLYCKT